MLTHKKMVLVLKIILLMGYLFTNFNTITYAENNLNAKQVAASNVAIKAFVMKDTAGKVHTLAQYKGKWVIVNYWATWCPPCLEEVPDLVALYDSRKNKDVVVLGVVFDYKSAQEVSEYVDDMLMSYPIILGDDDIVKQIGNAEVLPTTYIYNPLGQLVKTKKGLVTKQYLEKLISNN